MASPTTAAHVYLRLNGEEVLVGLLSQTQQGYAFQYDKAWLSHKDAFAIDPINLPLCADKQTGYWAWRCFEDGFPDRWGQRVKLCLQPYGNLLDGLIDTHGLGSGALRLKRSTKPSAYRTTPPDFEDLPSLMPLIEGLDDGNLDLGLIAPELGQKLLRGSWMGGARPKIALTRDGQHCLVKLADHRDLHDDLRAEYAVQLLAEACGLNIAKAELLEVAGRQVLISSRFDRQGDQPIHYLSANALTNRFQYDTKAQIKHMSYRGIALLIRQISAEPEVDLVELYSRMVFNSLFGITDDHLKNHGFLYAGNGKYRLSPAFDLAPQPLSPIHHGLLIGPRGGFDASLENLLSEPRVYGLTRQTAKGIIQQQIDQLPRLPHILKKAGLTGHDLDRVSRAFKLAFVVKEALPEA